MATDEFNNDQRQQISPLRLNEISATTAPSFMLTNHRRSAKTERTMTVDQLALLRGGIGATLGEKQVGNMMDISQATNSYLVSSNHSNSKFRANNLQRHFIKRTSSKVHLKHHQAQCRNNFHLLQLVAHLIVVILLLVVSPTRCLLADLIHPSSSSPSLCPLVQSCHCKWSNGKQVATCDRRALQAIPQSLPSDTQVLDMNGNNLSQLPTRIFQDHRLTNLQRLYLSECKISYIADEAFAQLTNLVELDLSHNNLQQVPSKALEPVSHSLRKLGLAYNMIHVVDSTAFSSFNRLNSLDLANNQISQLRSSAFNGLADLRELKLSENHLSQLPLSVVVDLRENLIIELYGNPWHCDCELRQSIEWMQRRNVQQSINPTCSSPARHKDIRWQNVKVEEFMCPPMIINKPQELVVGAGSNVTLACSARGSAPLTFVWFQDEKNLTGRGPSNQTQPSTKLLEERRYEIEEVMAPNTNITTSYLSLMNLKLTDTSLFLCWVENAAGYTLGNFSLIVNDSPPLSSAPGSSLAGNSWTRIIGLDSYDSLAAQIAHILASILVLLVALITCLLLVKQIPSNRSSKSSSSSDLKARQANGKLSGSNKFSSNGKMVGSTANGRMFASTSDDDVGASDEDNSSTGSSSAVGSHSSCHKGNATGSKLSASNNLDGFIEHMRSGIINIDYHSMSPAIQFNNSNMNNGQSNQQHLRHHYRQHPQQHHQQPLTHFPSASKASSQFYGQPTSNGSNSMATTLSDLSPSSSTSFANSSTNTLVMAPNQQQFVAGSVQTLLRQPHQQQHPAPMASCDFPLVAQQELAAYPAPSEFPVGYGGPEDSMGRIMPPPMYQSYEVGYLQQQQQVLYNQQPQPPSMVGAQDQRNKLPNGRLSQPQQPERFQVPQDPNGFQIL